MVTTSKHRCSHCRFYPWFSIGCGKHHHLRSLSAGRQTIDHNEESFSLDTSNLSSPLVRCWCFSTTHASAQSQTRLWLPWGRRGNCSLSILSQWRPPREGGESSSSEIFQTLSLQSHCILGFDSSFVSSLGKVATLQKPGLRSTFLWAHHLHGSPQQTVRGTKYESSLLG